MNKLRGRSGIVTFDTALGSICVVIRLWPLNDNTAAVRDAETSGNTLV